MIEAGAALLWAMARIIMAFHVGPAIGVGLLAAPWVILVAAARLQRLKRQERAFAAMPYYAKQVPLMVMIALVVIYGLVLLIQAIP